MEDKHIEDNTGFELFSEWVHAKNENWHSFHYQVEHSLESFVPFC